MFLEQLSVIWNNIVRNIMAFRFADAIDIIAVTILLYFVFKFIRDRRAGKLAAGIITLILLLAVGNLVNLRVIRYFFQNIFQVGIIAIIIVFQPELRAALEKVGGGSLKGVRGIGESKSTDGEREKLIRSVTEASTGLSKTKTGALIVFERSTKLGDLALTGTIIDSAPSEQLIKNVFFKNSPLHDGALIIRENRLYAAGCVLPLSSNPDITKDLGTRHRAALGMSENSDALVLIVSEETGIISLASDGVITRGYSEKSLAEALNAELDGGDKNSGIRSKFGYFKTSKSPKVSTAKKKSKKDEN